MSVAELTDPVTPADPVDREVLARVMGPGWSPVAAEVPLPVGVPREVPARGRRVAPGSRTRLAYVLRTPR